jgi:glycosyltransferase involved in cell wall biosynthesis
MVLLVLYEELAGYFLSCVRTLASEYHCAVHVVHKEVNPEAPFVFDPIPGVTFYPREKYSEATLLALAQQLSPNAILCGGWIQPAYRKISRQFVAHIPVILAFDNQWKGTWKQWGGSLISPFYIQTCFNRCFVPGAQQKTFALRLGFQESDIRTGLYSCDQGFFSQVYHESLPTKTACYPRRFIYAGRYIPAKGIHLLWDAFMDCLKEEPSSWELWCLGTGPEKPLLHPQIRHCGFVQPAQVPELMKQTGVFVLPSLFEPWGVALHEFVAAGFPIICSTEVGAAEYFLRSTENGFRFQAGQKEELKVCMKKIMRLSDSALLQMGQKSNELSSQITPLSWASTIQDLIGGYAP